MSALVKGCQFDVECRCFDITCPLTLDPAYKLLDYVPPKELAKSTDALDQAVMGGEANGFCAGFYYALRMMKQIRGLHAAAEKYYEVPKQEVEAT